MASHQKIGLVILLLSLLSLAAVILSGVGGVPSPNSEIHTSTPTPNVDPASEYGTITIQAWNVSTDDRIMLEINVNIIGSIENFEANDVMLCGYRNDGEKLFERNLGSLSANRVGQFGLQKTINTTNREMPSYITVDHPNFRNNNKIQTEVLEWNHSRLLWDVHMNYEEMNNAFGFPRSNETGVCG